MSMLSDKSTDLLMSSSICELIYFIMNNFVESKFFTTIKSLSVSRLKRSNKRAAYIDEFKDLIQCKSHWAQYF